MRLGKKQRNALFYWSLFDPRSWWEESGVKKPNYIPPFTRGHNWSIKTIKECSPTLARGLSTPRTIERFKSQFIYEETLANYMIAAEIDEQLKSNGLKGAVDKGQLKARVFPDIIIRDTRRGRVNIEVKAKSQAKNLVDRVHDEIVPKLKEETVRATKKFIKTYMVDYEK